MTPCLAPTAPMLLMPTSCSSMTSRSLPSSPLTIFGARSRNFGSMYFSQRSSGSRMWPSASMTTHALLLGPLSAGAADRDWLRRQIGCGGNAARGLVRLAQLVERALAVDGAFAVGEEGLPRHALRIGNPLLVRLVVAAGGVLGLNGWALGAGQPIVNLREFTFVLNLDAEMGNTSGAPPGDAVADIDVARMIAATGADCEVDPWVIKHPFGVVRLNDGRLGCEQRRIEPDRRRQQI